jgi:hypothetical protein
MSDSGGKWMELTQDYDQWREVLNLQIVLLVDSRVRLQHTLSHSYCYPETVSSAELSVGCCLFQIVGSGMNVSFIWQLDVGSIEDTCPIKTEFKVQYSPIINLTKLVSGDETGLYRCNFDINDYKVCAYIFQNV